MAQDDIDQIPSIVPSREGVQGRGTTPGGKAGGKNRRRADHGSSGPGGGGVGLFARLIITIALVAAAVACAWAWQLQAELRLSEQEIASQDRRIADLEARLSDTDEGMNQNAEVQAAKLRELDTEVRKLWDNVWKQSKQRLGKLEGNSASQAKSLQAIESQLQAAAADIGKLKSVAGDLSRLMTSAKANQAEVERVADSLNRIELDMAKLDKRVSGNEEWVSSINAFRRQINASLTELQASVRALQATP